MTDDVSPEEAAEAEAARKKSSAQSAASDLARMGIDPAALGLQGPRPPRPPQHPPSRQGPQPPPGQGPVQEPDTQRSGSGPQGPHDGGPGSYTPQHGGNVVPLRRGPDPPSRSQLPESGTSPAWAPEPPPINASGSGDVDTRAVPLEFLLGRAGDREHPKSSPAQLARAITFGMITPDAAEAAEREREMVKRVRTRQTDQRIVVFLSGKGGVGATSVAIGVGCVLAALRDDATTLTSLRPGTPSLGRALAGTPAPTSRELARPETEVAPLKLNNGLQLVDGPRWGTPIRRSDVPAIVDRLGQTSAFALFDVGNDASEAGHSILSRADQIVIVAGTGAGGLDGARVAVERAAEIDPYFLDSAIYVVACQREAAMKGVVRAMRQSMPGGGRVVAVPPDESLAEGAAFDPSRVSVATRLAMIDIAGLVALGSVAQAIRH